MSFYHKSMKKHMNLPITPHRLCVAIFIYQYRQLRDSESFVQADERTQKEFVKVMCQLSLKLLQTPDIQLEDLMGLSIYNNLLIQMMVYEYNMTLQKIGSSSARELLDMIDFIGNTVNPEPSHLKAGINKSSVIGYFFRRLIVHFDMMSFSQITDFLAKFKEYSQQLTKKVDRNDYLAYMSRKVQPIASGKHKKQWSIRQAELFIATQSNLLLNNEQKAMTPKDMAAQIKELLECNHDIPELHFLSYLNFLRVQDFSGALESIYLCFDKAVACEKLKEDGRYRSNRYATLCLAVLHHRFGHREEALASLKECIRLAQEANDSICLQYALCWLYALTTVNKNKLIEHSILKSLDLSLPYTMSLGIQSFCYYAGVTSGNPRQTFETITKSDIINMKHAYQDLTCNSYAQKSSLWYFYGKSEMASLWSQLLLCSNTDYRSWTGSTCCYGEGFCLALCNMAYNLHQQGSYNLSVAIIDLLKEIYPHAPNNASWMLSENMFRFVYALQMGAVDEAELAAQRLLVTDKWESCLRMTELYLHKRDYDGAFRCIDHIMTRCRDGKWMCHMDVQVRAMLLLARIQLESCGPDDVPAGILGLLHSALSYAKDFHMTYLEAQTQMHIAHVQLRIGQESQALHTLEKCMVPLQCHANTYDRATSMLLYAECTVAKSYDLPDSDRVVVIEKAIHILQRVRTDFAFTEAFNRVKYVVFLQALLYNEIGQFELRNKAALQFRELNDLHPEPITLVMVQ